uniref:THUMP domain-containing protein n=1 Tax=Guillardia theta TaxID=55529 RepID=A0A7S4N006_GUITH
MDADAYHTIAVIQGALDDLKRFMFLNTSVRLPQSISQKASQLSDGVKEFLSSFPSEDPAGGEDKERKDIKCSQLVTTNPGLERIAASEVRSICHVGAVHPSCFGCPGYLGLTDVKDAEKLQELRSAHDVLKFHGYFLLPEAGRGQELIQAICKGVQDLFPQLDSVMGSAESFRVRSERVGSMRMVGNKQDTKALGEDRSAKKARTEKTHSEIATDAAEEIISAAMETSKSDEHGFQSSQVEREVGSVLHEKYKVRADMKKFEVCIRVDIVMDKVLVCSMPNKDQLSRRHKLAFVRSVTLKPNVAYCMIRMSGLKDGGSLLDPFCGGGTIPMEAACIFGDKAGRLCGCDRSKTVVEGAKANAKASMIEHLVEFTELNARVLDRSFSSNSFDVIVTNPPWGVRVGKDADLERIYKGFLFSSAKILRVGGRLVFLVQRCEMVLELVRKLGLFRILSMCAVKTGDLVPTIFVLENLGKDEEKEVLKTQVRALTPLIPNPKAGGSAAPEQAEQDTPQETEPSL